MVLFLALLASCALLLMFHQEKEAELISDIAYLCLLVGIALEVEYEWHPLRKLWNLLRGLPEFKEKTAPYFLEELNLKAWYVRFAIEKPRVAIYSLFALTTLLFTLPVIFNFSSSYYGLPGDGMGGIWWGFWRKFSWEHNLHYTNITLVGAPYGQDLSNRPWQFLYVNVYEHLLRLFSPVVYWNLIIVLSFFLSALFMYFLVHYITKDKLSSTVAAIIYAFCPYHIFHAYQHLTKVTIQWIPLYLLFLLKLVDDQGRYDNRAKLIKNALLCAILYAILCLENYYYGYFMAIFTIVFLIIYYSYHSIKQGRLAINRNAVLGLLLVFAFAMIIIVPATYNIIKISLSQREGSPSPYLYSHPYESLGFFAAKVRSYFLPPIDNPLFGKLSYRITSRYNDYDNLFENTLFLGYLPLLLALLALVRLMPRYRWKDKEKNLLGSNLRSWTIIFSLVGIVMFIFSGPPVSTTLGLKVPLPSFFLHRLFPMFRVYARFGLLVMLCVSILAGIGMSYLFRKLKHTRLALYMLVVFLAVVLVEFANFPPYKTTSSREVPRVYHWLALQPGDFIIAEYPMVASNEVRHYQYLFYQRAHKKRLINGAQVGTPGEELRKKLIDIERSQTIKTLASLGTKYILIHKDMYQQGTLPLALRKYYNTFIYSKPLPEFNNNEEPVIDEKLGLQRVGSFEEVDVYEIVK